MRPTKYYSKKTTVDGIVFQSKLEARRYKHLKLLERAGEISELQWQIPYLLIDTQRYPNKPTLRKETYVLDFQYRDKNGTMVYEDTKGYSNEKFPIKQKQMLEKYGIYVDVIKEKDF